MINNFIIYFISGVAGFLVKWLDLVKEEEKSSIYLSIISSFLLLLLALNFPEFVFGTALGVAVLGKTKRPTQFLNFLSTLFGFLLKIGEVNIPYFLLSLILSIGDELIDKKIGKRPILPLGLFFLYLSNPSFYVLSALITLIIFDTFYSLAALTLRRGRKKNAKNK